MHSTVRYPAAEHKLMLFATATVATTCSTNLHLLNLLLYTVTEHCNGPVVCGACGVRAERQSVQSTDDCMTWVYRSIAYLIYTTSCASGSRPAVPWRCPWSNRIVDIQIRSIMVPSWLYLAPATCTLELCSSLCSMLPP